MRRIGLNLLRNLTQVYDLYQEVAGGASPKKYIAWVIFIGKAQFGWHRSMIARVAVSDEELTYMPRHLHMVRIPYPWILGLWSMDFEIGLCVMIVGPPSDLNIVGHLART